MATVITTQMESELCFTKISSKGEHKLTEELEHLTETSKTCHKNEEYDEKNTTDVQNIVPTINQDDNEPLSSSDNVEDVQIPLTKDQEDVEKMTVSPCTEDSQSTMTVISDNKSLSKRDDNSFQQKKHRAILDSDSEEENVFASNTRQKLAKIDEHNSNSEDSDIFPNKKTGTTVCSKDKRKLLDSDSEDDEQRKTLENIAENEDTEVKESMYQNMSKSDNKNSKISKLIDSDSEDDTENIFKNTIKNTKRSSNQVMSSEASDESDKDETHPVQSETPRQVTPNNSEADAKQKLSNKLKALIDSESEDEESEVRHFPIEEHAINKSGKVKSEKKQKGSIRASKEEAMKQIHSETQRFLRERAVSLPYHRPKQRTLQEFLNRKKVAPILPQAPTTAAKLKMSSEIVSKILEEKEKEAELFYKSSDSEDETTDVPNELNDNKTSKVCVNKTDVSHCRNTIEDISIEETQRAMKNNVQNAHNKKEILQQGTTDIGVPRQLFGKDFSVIETNNLGDIMDKDEDRNSEGSSNYQQKQQCKEHKVGLREASVPRKLFDESEPMETEDCTLEKDEQHPSNENDKNIAQANDENCENKCLENSLDVSISEEHSTNITSSQVILNERDSGEIKKTPCFSGKLGITETPHISNTEVAKLLHKQKEHELNNVSQNQETLEHPEETSKKVFNTGKDLLTFNSEIETSEKMQESMEQNSDDETEGQVLGLPPPEIEDNKISKNMEVKKKLLSNVLNVKPKLRGSPGMVIDLTGNMKPNKQGINTLIDRFCKHTSVTKAAENIPDVTVIHMEETINGLIPVKETLPYQMTSTNNEDPELSKPGAKLLRLKEDLKLKMAVKRREEWAEKEKQQKLDEEEDMDNDETDCLKKTKENNSDDFNESEEGEPESEPEENDILIKEKKTKNHQFADDEAEVSDDDRNEDETEVNQESDEDECDDMEADVDEEENANNSCSQEEDDESDSEEDSDKTTARKKKKLRRIIQPFDEDSNATSTRDLDDEINNKRKTVFERSKTDVDIFESDNGNDAWINSNENDLPQDFLRAKAVDQSCRTPQTKSNDILRFISPATQLTSLKGPDSNRKPASNREDMLAEACGSVSVDNTQYEKMSQNSVNFEKRVGLQKKLFDDFGETPNDDEIMQLCSGKFPSTQTCQSNMIPPIGSTIDTNVTNSQLLDLCSGTFSTQDNVVKRTQKINADTPNEEESQDIRLFLNDNSPSPLKHVQGKSEPNTSNAPWSNFRIASSSDEEEVSKDTQEDHGKKKVLKKRKVKKLDLSDEEDAENNSDEEEDEEEENAEEMDDDEKYLDYDSEENEIVVSKKSIKKAAADFLEKEAELSESEWGSADEDEKDLDKLEMEEVDDEEIDENQMKDQIGKMHVRQLLDEDQREVRLLKELLFEDGDLHTEGGGRERKFKWKNIDKLGEDNGASQPFDDNDGWVDPLENEVDVEQIKLRHEREKFLQERKKDSDDDLEEELGDSQFFKLGMKALKKIKKNEAKAEDDSASVTQSEDRLFCQSVSDILNSKNSGKKAQALYRHSLLARGEETLVRIAKVVKDTDVTSVSKRPGKFYVFTSISPVKEDTKENKEEAEAEVDVSRKRPIKRKAPRGGTPKITKKSKFDANETIVKTLFD